MTRLTRSEGFASSGAGADFSFASNDFKTLGAFFCNFTTFRSRGSSAGVAHGQRGRVPDVVGSRLPAHTISRPEFNLFKPLRRHFRATPSCRQPLAPRSRPTAAWELRNFLSLDRRRLQSRRRAGQRERRAGAGEAARLDRLPVRRAGSRQPVIAIEHAAINSRSYPATTSSNMISRRSAFETRRFWARSRSSLAVGLEIPRWLFVVIDRLRYPAVGSGPIRRPYHRCAFSERNFRKYSDSVRHRERQRRQATCLLAPLCAAASATAPTPRGSRDRRRSPDQVRRRSRWIGASLRILPHIQMSSRLFSRAAPNRKRRLDL